jgi:hypothetical protein
MEQQVIPELRNRPWITTLPARWRLANADQSLDMALCVARTEATAAISAGIKDHDSISREATAFSGVVMARDAPSQRLAFELT